MRLPIKNVFAESEIKKFIVIYYLVGLLGFIIPTTRELFKDLIPVSIIISAYLIFILGQKFKFPSYLGLILVYLIGYFIEVAGIYTGLIFGKYLYGNSLGPKLFGVPLIIGINWLILSYASVSLLSQFNFKNTLVLFIAPLFMVIYDLFLEQVAHKLNMWYWLNITVPIKNYIAWYILGFIMVLILRLFRVDFKNSFAPLLFCSQFIFFLLLFFLM
ncbi:carotenoid biosynthesis protein [Melioribacter sp. OK-6-Me]|uniref:carotenoid biosynthesis protein n=1 Tax=unclassified Melioribacter TaxID=2627329 RepID=UPI003EDAC1B7